MEIIIDWQAETLGPLVVEPVISDRTRRRVGVLMMKYAAITVVEFRRSMPQTTGTTTLRMTANSTTTCVDNSMLDIANRIMSFAALGSIAACAPQSQCHAQ